jgi:predicted transcriptional regulator of viral defense system
VTSSSLDRRRRLTALAGQQGGFFTAKQASELGFSTRLQHHHSQAENWRRIDRGLYRLPGWPADPNESFIVATLWSRGLGVISHESALSFFEISDVMPNEVHLIVPPAFRKRPVPGITLHRGKMRDSEIINHGAFRTTTPLRTLTDLAIAHTSPEHLAAAVDTAFRQGLVRKQDLLEACLDLPGSAAVALRAAIRSAGEAL